MKSSYLDLADTGIDPNVVLLELAGLDPGMMQIVKRVLAVTQYLGTLHTFAGSLPMIENIPHTDRLPEDSGPVLDLAPVLEAAELLPEDIRPLIRDDISDIRATLRSHNAQVSKIARLVTKSEATLRDTLRDDRYRSVLTLMERLVDQHEARQAEQVITVPVAPEVETIADHADDFDLALTPVRAEPLPPPPMFTEPLGLAFDATAVMDAPAENVSADELPDDQAEHSAVVHALQTKLRQAKWTTGVICTIAVMIMIGLGLIANSAQDRASEIAERASKPVTVHVSHQGMTQNEWDTQLPATFKIDGQVVTISKTK